MVEGGGEFFAGLVFLRSGSLLAEDVFEVGGEGLDFCGAEVAGDTFDGVGDSLGGFEVVGLEGGGDLVGGFDLLLDEFAEEFEVEFAVAADAAEAIGGVEARGCGEVGVGGGWRGWLLGFGFGCFCVGGGFEVASDGGEHCIGVDGFGDVIIHAGGDAAVAFFCGGVGGHGDDGERVEAFFRADFGSGLVAVHLGHLEVHEDEVEGVGVGLEGLDGLETIIGDRD